MEAHLGALPVGPAHLEQEAGGAADNGSSLGSPAHHWQHPPSFYCPVSQQVMHDPVVLCDGHTYERRHIERWLQEHNTSPVSGLQLAQREAYPNHALRNAIEEYFQQVFSVHRRAIRKTIRNPEVQENFGSNTAFLRTIDALMHSSLLMNADLSIENVLLQIIGEAKALVGSEAASVFLIDHAKRQLYSTVNSSGKEIRIPVGAGIAGHVANTGEPLIIPDAYSEPRFNKEVDKKMSFRTRNIMCVPLKVRGGVIGVVQLVNKSDDGVLYKDEAKTTASNRDSFSMDDLRFLQVFASQAALAIANSGALDEPTVPSSETSGDHRPRAWCDLEKSGAGESKHEETADSPAAITKGLNEDLESLPFGDWDIDYDMDLRESAESFADSETLGSPMWSSCQSTSPRKISKESFHTTEGFVQRDASKDSFCYTSERASEDGVRSEPCGAVVSEDVRRKRSGRARQRAAKYWNSVRCRTPSPDGPVVEAISSHASGSSG